MRLGIIGAGMIARFHAEAIRNMEGGQLHAIYARDAAKGQPLADEFCCRLYTDIDAFLADPELEVVTIATPSGAHLEPALAAIEAGKHVICEKPIEIETGRVDILIEAAEQYGVQLAGIFNRRFHPTMVYLKEAITQGRFGRITLCEASVHWYRDQAYYDSAAWRGTWRLDGGGALMNQSIHAIDQLLYLVGPVKRLTASIANLIHQRIEVEDTAVAILECENEARAIIQGSTACWSDSGHPAEIRICGEKGSVFLQDEAFTVWEFAEPAAEDKIVRENYMSQSRIAGAGANDPSSIDSLGHQRNFEDVIAAIQSGTQPLTSGSECRRAVALIEAIYESAGNAGAWIELSEASSQLIHD